MERTDTLNLNSDLNLCIEQKLSAASTVISVSNILNIIEHENVAILGPFP